MRREGKVHRFISAKLCLFVVTLINITIILLHHVDHLKNSLPGRRGHLSWMLRAEHSGVMMGLPWLKRWVTDPRSFKGFFHKSRGTNQKYANIFRSNSNRRRSECWCRFRYKGVIILCKSCAFYIFGNTDQNNDANCANYLTKPAVLIVEKGSSSTACNVVYSMDSL